MRPLLWTFALVFLLSGLVCEFVGGPVRQRWAVPLLIGGVLVGAWLGVTTP
jgi:hypothetical protein